MPFVFIPPASRRVDLMPSPTSNCQTWNNVFLLDYSRLNFDNETNIKGLFNHVEFQSFLAFHFSPENDLNFYDEQIMAMPI